MYKIVKKLDAFLEMISYRALVVSLFLMLGLSLVNIGCRWFNITFLWIDPLVRHLVFLSAFLGGSLATGSSKHIGIDLITKVLEKPKYQKWSRIHRIAISFVCFLVLVWLVKASYHFSTVEFQYGRDQFLGIHSGVLVSIIPVGFGIIALRFFFRFILSFEYQKGNLNA